MTVGLYSYIGQNYIFAYSKSKTSELKKEKNEKKSEKGSYFLGPCRCFFGGVYFEINPVSFFFCHNLIMLVPFCSYGDMLIAKIKKSGGVGYEKLRGRL